MKKILFIFAGLIIILLCMFPLNSFCKNTTEIRLNVYEIKVDCDKNGSFTVNEENYTGQKSFFVGEDANINITAIPKNGYMVEFIECEPQGNSILEKDQLVITNITDNINVNITFKPIEIPVAGLDIEEEVHIERNYWWMCGMIFSFIIVISMSYILYKKNKSR